VSEQEQKRVRAMVNDIVDHPENRDEIVAFVKGNGGLEYSRMRLDEYVDKAVRALDVLPDSQEKAFLVELAYFTARRDK
jgi:octaprenyl-diphosphate synthase